RRRRADKRLRRLDGCAQFCAVRRRGQLSQRRLRRFQDGCRAESRHGLRDQLRRYGHHDGGRHVLASLSPSACRGRARLAVARSPPTFLTVSTRPSTCSSDIACPLCPCPREFLRRELVMQRGAALVGLPLDGALAHLWCCVVGTDTVWWDRVSRTVAI